MDKCIFCLVGPSGSGKTTLIENIVARMPERVGIVKSTTTRQRRNDGELKHYDFVSPEEFERIKDLRGFINSQNFAGFWYGTSIGDLNSLLERKHGIWAMVESAYEKLIAAGYKLKIIRIVPDHHEELVRPERKEADLERSRIAIPTDLTVINSFQPGGLEKATAEICDFIRKF
jgi:guanylate kinase